METYILDLERNSAELARLMVQHDVITEGMDGLFPEYKSVLPKRMKSILDVGCGSGGWALDIAHFCPDRQVVGIDISPTVVAYNQCQAMVQRLDNVTFKVMDALQPFKFAEGTFDLVNVRFATAFVPREQWSVLLQNCLQVLRSGGILRVTEAECVGLTNSPACEKMHSWAAHLLLTHGYGFSPDGSQIGTLPMLNPLLQEVGCVNVKLMPHMLDFSSGTSLHARQQQNYMVWPILLKSSFLGTLSITEEEFEQIYQQMLEEMLMPQFHGIWNLLTIWGEKK